MRKSTFANLCQTLFLMMILGSVVCFIFVNSLQDLVEQYPFTQWIVQGIAILSYLFLMYSPLWHYGDRDVNRVNIKVKKEDKLTGLKAGLILMLVYVVMFVLLCLGKMGYITDLLPAYRMANCQFIMPFLALLGNVTYVTEVSYGTIAMITLVIPLIIPIATMIFYLIGYHRLSFMEKIMYKKPQEKK